MKVSSLIMDPFTGLPVVLLESDVGPSTMPISIGLGEASAIALELDSIEVERPMTHHLMCEVLAKAGLSVAFAEIYDWIDGTFFARIHLALPDGGEIVQDGRPSDVIALALRTGAELRVAAEVLEAATRLDLSASLNGGGHDGGRGGARNDADDAVIMHHARDVSAPGHRRVMAVSRGACKRDLSELSDEAFGKWKM